MDKHIDIKEIRELLGRFYEGMTSRAEERRLGAMLAGADALPPDLSAERELFLAMTAGVEDVEIPAEYEARVTGAVEAEMKKSRMRGVWFRRLAVAGSAAATLLLVWMAVALIMNNPESATVRGGGVAKGPNAEQQERKVAVTEEGQEKDTTLIVQPMQLARADEPKKGVRRPVAPRREEPAEEPEVEYLASTRRIVEDPEEAAAIIGSVFARLDDNMREEQFLIEEINDQYEIMTCKLY